MNKQAIVIFSFVVGLLEPGQVVEASRVAPTTRPSPLLQRGAFVRGGAAATETKKKRKKRKPPATAASVDKNAIDEAMKGADSAQALGDAIRNRANDWLDDDPVLRSIDMSVSSLGWAMGTSDATAVDADGGGVEAAPNSVLAHYFLKSHGGAHALQTLCSLFAVLLSLGSLVTKGDLQSMFLKRAFLCAMTKHLAGLLAATGMTAQAIPSIGFGKARRWMEQLARDPVSQYVFYAALLLVWSSTGSTWYNGLPMFGKFIPLILTGPVLIREVVSMAFVLSDILLLLQTSTGLTAVWWKTSQAFVNAGMSLLVTPTAWRSSTAIQRQALLAKLTAKISLGLEAMAGLLLVSDAGMALWQLSMTTPRPLLRNVALRLLCARLYVNFLWVRRRKIRHLGNTIRGGASFVPGYVLDALNDPLEAMGIEKMKIPSNTEDWTWKEYAALGLGLDEEKNENPTKQ